jgi:hypothetical protein
MIRGRLYASRLNVFSFFEVLLFRDEELFAVALGELGEDSALNVVESGESA